MGTAHPGIAAVATGVAEAYVPAETAAITRGAVAMLVRTARAGAGTAPVPAKTAAERVPGFHLETG